MGEGFREKTLDEKLAQAPKSPFGSPEGADPFEAEGMANALLKRGDYKDPIKHFFKAEVAKGNPGTMPYLAAVHDVMRRSDPEAAMKFAAQMKDAGLTKPEPKPAPVRMAQADTGTVIDATPPPVQQPQQPETKPEKPAPAPADPAVKRDAETTRPPSSP